VRYEVCVWCGISWNVSVRAPQGWYVCPRCREKLRRDERAEAAARRKKSAAGDNRRLIGEKL